SLLLRQSRLLRYRIARRARETRTETRLPAARRSMMRERSPSRAKRSAGSLPSRKGTISVVDAALFQRRPCRGKHRFRRREPYSPRAPAAQPKAWEAYEANDAADGARRDSTLPRSTSGT